MLRPYLPEIKTTQENVNSFLVTLLQRVLLLDHNLVLYSIKNIFVIQFLCARMFYHLCAIMYLLKSSVTQKSRLCYFSIKLTSETWHKTNLILFFLISELVLQRIASAIIMQYIYSMTAKTTFICNWRDWLS